MVFNQYTIFHITLIVFLIYNCSWSRGKYIATDNEPKTCEILGVQNKITDNKWKDERIGLGIKAILADELYKTGKFKFLETNDQIHQKRQEIATGMWNGRYKQKELPELINKSEGEFLVWAALIYFGRPQSELSIGLIHKDTDAAVVRIEIMLIQKSTGKKWHATGEGQSTTTASSVLFTDNGQTVALDETNIGNALKEAIKNAVKNIIK